MAEGCVGCTGLRVRTVFGSGCTSLNLISDTPDLLTIIQQDDCTFRFSVTPPDGGFSAIHTIPSSSIVFFGNGSEATPLAAMVRISADGGNIIQIRPDGLYATGGGGGSITADNGLTANTPTNVRLGGTLIQNTLIDNAGFGLDYFGTGGFNITGPSGNFHFFNEVYKETYGYHFVSSALSGPTSLFTKEVEFGVNPGTNRQIRATYDTLLLYSSHGTLSQPFNDEKSYAHHHGVEFLTDPSPVALNFGGGTTVDVAFVVEQANMQIYGDTKQFIGTGWFANHYSRLMFDSPSGGSMQHFVDYVAGGYYMFGFNNTGNTVTNRYGMYIRDMSASPYTVVNKYSIYAEGANDTMVHMGEVRIGSTTDLGTFKLQVTGNSILNGTDNQIVGWVDGGVTQRVSHIGANFTLNRFGSANDFGFNLDFTGTTLGKFRYNATTGAIEVGATHGSHPLDLWAGNTLKARMTNIGNFLIGTTTDTLERLQVQGNCKISGIAAPSGQTYMVTTNDQGVLSSQAIPGGGAGIPGGANTNIQFNNSGAFGGSNNFIWNGSEVVVVDTSVSTESNAITAVGGTLGGTSKATLGFGYAGVYYPRLWFDYASSSGVNTGISARMDGVEQMHFGIGNLAQFGGATGNASGRSFGVYNASGYGTTGWKFGINGDGDVFVGSSNSVFGVRMSQTGKTLIGTTSDSGQLLQVGGSFVSRFGSSELAFENGGTPTLAIKRTAGSGSPVVIAMHWNNPSTYFYSIEGSADTGEIREFITFGGFYKTFWANGGEAMRLTTNKNLLINTTTDELQKLQVAGNATTNSLVKFGSIEIQPYAVNNAWFGDNTYYTGTGFVRRQAGYAELFYFLQGEGQFRLDDTGAAGSSLSGAFQHGKVPLKFHFNGGVGLGGDITPTPGIFTGATLEVNSTHLVLRNSTTSGTNRSLQFINASSIDDLGRFQMRTSTGTNTTSVIEIMPRGTGLFGSLKSRYSAFNTDFIADGINYELVSLAAAGPYFTLSTLKNGTGVARPIYIDATTNDSAASANMILTTAGNTLFGGTTDFGYKIQVFGQGYIGEGLIPSINTNPLNNNLSIQGWTPNNNAGVDAIRINTVSGNAPAGAESNILSMLQFTASSGLNTQGSGQWNIIKIAPTLNSPANGGNQAHRGIYYTPTITAIAAGIQHNAFESTSGDWVMGGSQFFFLKNNVGGNHVVLFNKNTTGGQGRLALRPSGGGNTIGVLDVMPEGNPTGAGADIGIYGTDYLADSVNYDKIGIQAADPFNMIYSYKGGTGTVKKIIIDATGTASDTTANVIFQTNGNTLFGTTTDSGEKVQIAGTVRVSYTGGVAANVVNLNLGSNSKLNLSADVSGSLYFPRVFFDYASTDAGTNGGFVNRLDGNYQMFFGMSNQALFGGTADTSSGAFCGIYSYVTSAWKLGLHNDGTFYIGSSNTVFGVRMSQDGKTLIGTTTDSGQKLQVGGTALVLASAASYSLEVQNSNNVGAFISGVNGSGVEAQSQNSYSIGGVIIPSSTSTVDTVMKLTRSSSGTAANGIGGSLDFYTKTTVMGRLSNKIVSKWNDATDASRTSQYEIHGVNSAADTVLLTVTGAGLFTLTQGLQNFANDAAAAGGGIPVNGLYRNGSVVQIRVS